MRPRYIKSLIVAALLAALTCSCGGEADGTPRPRGFARVEAYADSLTVAELPEVTFEVNAEADRACPRPGWMDVAFPRYGATLHISATRYTSAEDYAEAVRNRSERTSLNLAGRRAEVEEYTNGAGFRVRLTRSLEPSPLPLQFMAADSAGRFVTGAVAFSGAVEPADSVAPAVADMRRQLDVILQTLSPR